MPREDAWHENNTMRAAASIGSPKIEYSKNWANARYSGQNTLQEKKAIR